MNRYEEKQEARRQRYEDKAEQLKAESEATLARARRLADIIPFGQPILVGHYSEKRDRGFRARISRTWERGFEAAEKAKHYAQKAASVGTGGIASEDPEAVTKLREKLAKLEAEQAQMKAINAAHKKFLKDPESLDKTAFSETTKALIRSYVPRYSWEPHPIAPYQLTNNGAEIRRVKARIEELGRKAEQPRAEYEIGDVRIVEDPEDNRVRLYFEGKPADAVRAQLKSYGFRWSPTVGAWQQHLSPLAIYRAKEIANSMLPPSPEAA